MENKTELRNPLGPPREALAFRQDRPKVEEWNLVWLSGGLEGLLKGSWSSGLCHGVQPPPHTSPSNKISGPFLPRASLWGLTPLFHLSRLSCLSSP